MPDYTTLLMLSTALGSGLVAGVFFAFSTFVMKALEDVPTEMGIRVMQAINITVINPWFLGAFMGTGILCLVGLFFAYPIVEQTRGMLWLSGSIVYLAGSLLVTILFNIPRNEQLSKVQADDPEGAVYWRNYLATWTFWNHVRTVASFAAAGLLGWAAAL